MFNNLLDGHQLTQSLSEIERYFCGAPLGSWVILRLCLKEFSKTFLAAKVKPSPANLFLKSRSFRNVGLAVGILNELFWVSLSVQFFPSLSHVFNKVVKKGVEEEKEDDE